MAKKPRDAKKAAANDFDDDADAIIEAAQIEDERVIGAVGDFLLEELKQTFVWKKMTQDEQDRLINRCGDAARQLTAGVIRAVANRGLEHTVATIADKGGFEEGFFTLKVSVPMNAKTTELLRSSRGSEIQIVFADSAEFESSMLSKADPDQPALLKDARDEADGEDVEGQSFDKTTGEIKPDKAAPALGDANSSAAPSM